MLQCLGPRFVAQDGRLHLLWARSYPKPKCLANKGCMTKTPPPPSSQKCSLTRSRSRCISPLEHHSNSIVHHTTTSFPAPVLINPTTTALGRFSGRKFPLFLSCSLWKGWSGGFFLVGGRGLLDCWYFEGGCLGRCCFGRWCLGSWRRCIGCRRLRNSSVSHGVRRRDWSCGFTLPGNVGLSSWWRRLMRCGVVTVVAWIG